MSKIVKGATIFGPLLVAFHIVRNLAILGSSPSTSDCFLTLSALTPPSWFLIEHSLPRIDHFVINQIKLAQTSFK